MTPKLPMDAPRLVKAVRTRAPALPDIVRARALEAVAHYVGMARSHYSQRFKMPNVAFDLRGRSAGQASPSENLLRFNPVLLAENEDVFLVTTVPHEVAHLVTVQLYSRKAKPHGTEWKAVMKVLGVAPKRCHVYDVSNSRVGVVHRFRCACVAPHLVSSRRAKTARAGKLVCKKCKSVLRAAPATSPQPSLASEVAMAPRVEAPLPTKSGVRAPSYEMLCRALTVAARFGIALLSEHVANQEACADFLLRYDAGRQR